MCVVDKFVKVDILVLRPETEGKAWGFLPCDQQRAQISSQVLDTETD